MNANSTLSEPRPLTVLQELIDRHGRLSVLALALTALVRPVPRPSSRRVLAEAELSGHILRDIGLDPPTAARGWEHYR